MQVHAQSKGPVGVRMQVHEPLQSTWSVDGSGLGDSCTRRQELGRYRLGEHTHERAADPSSPQCEAPRSLVVFLTNFSLPTCFLPSSTHPASLKCCFVLYQSWLLGSYPESPCWQGSGNRENSFSWKNPTNLLGVPWSQVQRKWRKWGLVSMARAALLSQQPALPPAPGPTVPAPGFPSSTWVENKSLPGQSQGLLRLLCGFSPAARLH